MIILLFMDSILNEMNFAPTVIAIFFCVMLLVALVITVLLLQDLRRKQRLYCRFSNSLNESLVVFSSKMEFLYCLPIYSSDPLIECLNGGLSLSEIVGSGWARMQTYFDEIDKHLGMPFLFSLDPSCVSSEDNTKALWYELSVTLEHLKSGDFQYVCFFRNISKENENRTEMESLQNSLDSLLQNTGDFLWIFDVEDRKMRLLTPMMDDEHRVIPQSVGQVDIQSMMPEGDFALLNKVLNERILDYRNFGYKGNPFETIKVRFYGPGKTLVWYGLRGKLVYDENNRLVFQGSARRMDVVLDNPMFGDDNIRDSMFTAALAIPDVRIFWVDKDFKIEGCNQAFATDFQIINSKETFGKSLDQVMGHKFLTYAYKVINDVFNQGRSMAWKGGFDRKDRLLMFNAVPLKSDQNTITGVMCVYMLLDENDFRDELKKR